MSGSIRPAGGNDVSRVVELYQRVVRSKRHAPPPGLAPYFERTLFNHPWADPELPSLVYEAEDGRVLGFIGSHARRVDFGGRRLRMGVAGQLVSDPHGHRAVGAMLLRRYLSGPQDLTITDGATGPVNEMWAGLGGRALQPESIIWTRLLRPSRAVGDWWLARRGRERWRGIAAPLFSMLDTAATGLARPAPQRAPVESEELTPQTLIERQGEMFQGARLRLAYDEEFVEWLFREMAFVRTRGTLVPRLLRRSGRVLGWYIVYLRRNGLSQVIEVAAAKGAIDAVLDALFAEAWQSGAAGIEGRLEPRLYEPLAQRRCFLRHGTRALYHTRDPEVEAAMALAQSGLTRLDGEWWMGHHTEPFA